MMNRGFSTLLIWLVTLALPMGADAKTFQNSYVSFEVPDNWNCLQEGVAWTCTPQNSVQSREAVIVLAAKVAGPEDNLNNFLVFLKNPKKITTKVGTPMPSQVMYAQNRSLAGNNWVQAQHLGSEIQDYYTLYLATVKDQLAILISFTAERNHYQTYHPIFDKAIKTLKIVANQQLLFPKNRGGGGSETFGIQVAPGTMVSEDVLPPPTRKKSFSFYLLLGFVVLGAGAAYFFLNQRNKGRKASSSKTRSSKPR